jgi:hypothetical protein
MPDGSNRVDTFAEMTLLVRSFQLAQMLHVAAELRLAGRLDAGPRPVAELAAECGADAPVLLRLCRALAAFGIFAVDCDGVVSQSARSACLSERAEPTLHHAAMFWPMAGNWAAWGNLEHAIRTGQPAFEATFGKPRFEYLKEHPDEAARFDRYMQHSPDDRHRAVAEAYDFSDAGLVVDVGGGNGALLAAVLAAFPQARGLLFEQPGVLAEAPPPFPEDPDRCGSLAGDFFATVPAGGDIYTLSRILHDWSDTRCLQILRNIRAAMTSGARLLVIERILEEGVLTDPSHFLTDMHMMVQFPGARERTQAEYAALLSDSGFRLDRVLATCASAHVMEARAV